jgi:hypothetical protein
MQMVLKEICYNNSHKGNKLNITNSISRTCFYVLYIHSLVADIHASLLSEVTVG